MAHILQSRNCASNGLKATAGGAHIKAKTRVHPNSSFQPSFFPILEKNKINNKKKNTQPQASSAKLLFTHRSQFLPLFMSVVNQQTNIHRFCFLIVDISFFLVS